MKNGKYKRNRESEERARCKMKADTREVILWKVRIISKGTMISRKVLKIKETF